MIILKISGGLGNQMFEYAFGKWVQAEVNQKIVLDISDYKYDKQRRFSLDHFRLEENIIIDDTGKYNMIYDQRKNPLIKLGVKVFPHILYKICSVFGIYIWDFARYKKVMLNKRKNLYFHGYWQGYVYFENIVDDIRREFKVRGSIEKKNRDFYDAICNTNSVCVHIRKGDYLEKKSGMYICSKEYYIEAMKRLEASQTNLHYFIFSDDIALVKNEIDFEDRKVTFIEQENVDYEELRLMYSCKSFIIANSTFSWWAAFLGSDSRKMVIAPRRWYLDKRNVSHMLLKDWVVLEN